MNVTVIKSNGIRTRTKFYKLCMLNNGHSNHIKFIKRNKEKRKKNLIGCKQCYFDVIWHKIYCNVKSFGLPGARKNLSNEYLMNARAAIQLYNDATKCVRKYTWMDFINNIDCKCFHFKQKLLQFRITSSMFNQNSILPKHMHFILSQ